MTVFDSSPLPPSNPFSTRFVRPGAIPYVLPSEKSLDSVIERLQSHAWHGAIIGPHGSGKSTLLAALASRLAAEGRSVVLIALSAGETSLPVTEAEAGKWTNATQVVVDGYEQLSWWSSTWLQRTCSQQGAGLLVTAHADVGMPVVHSTQVDAELACRISAQLQGERQLVTDEDVHREFAESEGNLRELLFALYDIYEERSRGL
jgi:hypothetical protein